MDEFTGIAVWVLMSFLVINAAIIWVGQDSFMQANSLGATGLTPSTMGTVADANSANSLTFFGTSCSSASANPVTIVGCGLVNITNTLSKIGGYFWGMLTAWVGLLDAILGGLGSIGTLFKLILIPVFALIEMFAITVLVLRIAGIIRGGS